uniref:Pseudouridine synthase RsuA/RluA-like domain-containing protein n=1 Tax=Chromera velia CCMP2878 TaxID=1169474 RepID=A0A0G4FKN9_9ALVE|eukprot:Cvel_17493.t1-p1 / transcript=Cvel_17493.t1 / gene=Cvel_17493 / organism=Chromera_velia_CCMP2878 / gene_product=hypothetical protein / transcript_product=hypothetical protein / location=Cvel_scaffold1400:36480-40195(-) / protein_length=538 / sequence_SO=supercontig / SO=protein_coding / is_pseudo=false
MSWLFIYFVRKLWGEMPPVVVVTDSQPLMHQIGSKQCKSKPKMQGELEYVLENLMELGTKPPGVPIAGYPRGPKVKSRRRLSNSAPTFDTCVSAAAAAGVVGMEETGGPSDPTCLLEMVRRSDIYASLLERSPHPPLQPPKLHPDDPRLHPALVNKWPHIRASQVSWGGPLEKEEPLFSHPVNPLQFQLDAPTSGLMILASTNTSLAVLHRHLSLHTPRFVPPEHSIHRVFLAVLNGYLPLYSNAGVIVCRAPICRPSPGFEESRLSGSRREGREALSLIAVRAHARISGVEVSVAEMMPLTTVRHQLRLHAAALGRPVVGDVLYQRSRRMEHHPDVSLVPSEEGETGRLMLHCWKIVGFRDLLGISKEEGGGDDEMVGAFECKPDFLDQLESVQGFEGENSLLLGELLDGKNGGVDVSRESGTGRSWSKSNGSPDLLGLEEFPFASFAAGSRVSSSFPRDRERGGGAGKRSVQRTGDTFSWGQAEDLGDLAFESSRCVSPASTDESPSGLPSLRFRTPDAEGIWDVRYSDRNTRWDG